jgi:hypothetical protein
MVELVRSADDAILLHVAKSTPETGGRLQIDTLNIQDSSIDSCPTVISITNLSVAEYLKYVDVLHDSNMGYVSKHKANSIVVLFS